MFDIDSGDTPRALLVIAGAGGALTIGVLALAFLGAVLALAGAPGVVIAAAAFLAETGLGAPRSPRAGGS